MALDVDHLTRAIGQFTLAQPSDATANNPSCTPAGTTNEADQTQSLLLSLPGEIRNQIFELVINQNTTIVLRAERIHMKNGKPGYRFHPKTPAFFATCRKLRAEFPMARYYATNSFVFSDNMFQTGAIAAFVEANKPAVEHMTHARVSHILNPYVDNHRVKSSGSADC